jgi:hypothetical protein
MKTEGKYRLVGRLDLVQLQPSRCVQVRSDSRGQVPCEVGAKIVIAARMANVNHGGDRKSKNQSANLRLDINRAAKAMNVSARTVDAAKTVLRDGGPGMIAAVARIELRRVLENSLLSREVVITS